MFGDRDFYFPKLNIALARSTNTYTIKPRLVRLGWLDNYLTQKSLDIYDWFILITPNMITGYFKTLIY